MEKRSKAETFIGFAMRKGEYRFGGNACKSLKRANLIIVCKTAAKNSLDMSLSLARKFNCKRFITKEKTLAELTKKENAKIMAITDKELAKAISENPENDLTECLIGE